MRILLLGANGQVGHELRRSLRPLGEVVSATRAGLLEGQPCRKADFDEPEALPALVDAVEPDCVVNAAAYTAVDKAESEPEAAYRANAIAPGVLARACAARGIPLVHYSTDYVFDGRGTRPYREDDPVAPLGIYGASKLAGERAIVEAGGRHHIFRTAWVYGWHGHNFMRTMLRLGAERDALRVVADQVGSPTPAWLIADVTARLLQRGHEFAPGIRHLTASGLTSWHGFAEAIFAEAVQRGLLARAPQVAPIATADYPTPAARPAYSCLDTGRLEQELAEPLPSWRDALGRTFAEAPAFG
ncbi:dTDP-4-dehydrorhamnose reductase [Pseudoxanthomonas mexicana]|uniref:dTDP-4-dehydrorhamnose reductase n=1 Tax=Pseudoxanthomonas mexicana TaxID=128785 RepID=UPI00398A521C